MAVSEQGQTWKKIISIIVTDTIRLYLSCLFQDQRSGAEAG